MNDIPLIDFSAWFHGSPKQRLDLANDIISAAHQPGFMYLQNFGVDPRETTKMFDMLEEYFALPLSIKQKNPYISAEANHGYNGFEEERLDPQGPGDLKETFTMRNVSQVSDNPTLWPSTNFRNMAQHFFHSCQLASNKILEALSLGLHMPQDYFVKYHTGENQTLRFLHYPQLPTHRPNQIGAGRIPTTAALPYCFKTMLAVLRSKIPTDIGYRHRTFPKPQWSISVAFGRRGSGRKTTDRTSGIRV